MENRREKRFGEHTNVLLKDKSQAQETAPLGAVNAYTHDMSVSGAWVCCEMSFPVGYVIRIAIDLGSGEPPVEVDGEVIWARESRDGKHFDIGVEFLHRIPDTILSLLKHFYGKKDAIPSSVS
jgi:hypothetical protein